MKDEQEHPAGPLAKQALSHPERFDILGCITQRGTGIGEGELADVLGLTRAKVKYHLTVLRNADLVAPVDHAPDRYVAAAGT